MKVENWKIHCDDHFSLSSTSAVHIWIIFIYFTSLRSRLKKQGGAEFFKRLRGVWISDETHFRVLDMAFQMSNNSWRNSRLKFAKFYGN